MMNGDTNDGRSDLEGYPWLLPRTRSTTNPFLELRNLTYPIVRMGELLSNVMKTLNAGAPDKLENQLKRLRDRLIVLHRLDICKDLDPNDEIDLLQLWLDRTVILTVDGGGFYILWTMQLLKELETVANRATEGEPALSENRHYPCGDIFDVVAGTSAGAVTAALIGKGWSAEKIERDFWASRAKTIWNYRNPLQGFFLDFLIENNFSLSHYLWRSFFFSVDPPLVDKKNFRDWAREEFENVTMGEFSTENRMGLFLMSTDMNTGYTVPAGGLINPLAEVRNLVAEAGKPTAPIWCRPGNDSVLVRAALEAAASPPLLVQPLGQYIDAGAGPDNDPTLTVLREIYRLRKDQRKQGIQRAKQKSAEIWGGSDTNTEEANTNDAAASPSTISESKRYLKDVTDALEELEANYWILSQSLKNSEEYTIHPKATETVLSFSTSFVRAPRVPVKIIQKPLWPLAFWMDWIINEFYLKSSHGPVRLLSDSENFTQVDYRRFNLTLGLTTLQNPLSLGPYSKPFERLPGISGTSTTTVTEEDLYYLRWLLEARFMPFYKAVGEATVEYLRERTRKRDARPGVIDPTEISLTLWPSVEKRLAKQFLTIVYKEYLEINERYPKDEHVNARERELDLLDEYLGILHSAVVTDLDWRGEPRLSELREFTSALLLRTVVDHHEGPPPDLQVGSAEENFMKGFEFLRGKRAAARGAAREAADAFERSMHAGAELGPAAHRPPENTGYNPAEVLSAERIWNRLEADLQKDLQRLRNLVHNNYSNLDLLQSRPLDREATPVNPFKYGLQGELLDYEKNLYAEDESLKETSIKQMEQGLKATLGNPTWLEDQPTDGPRQGRFAFPLPSFKPPYFQEHDHPLRHLNPLSREFKGNS